ncbi:hypothetical protein EZS27_030083, partial [termite gut metagenome]
AGACPDCEGFGKVIGIDEHLVVPNRALSVYDGAVICWRGEKISTLKPQLIESRSIFCVTNAMCIFVSLISFLICSMEESICESS